MQKEEIIFYVNINFLHKYIKNYTNYSKCIKYLLYFKLIILILDMLMKKLEAKK